MSLAHLEAAPYRLKEIKLPVSLMDVSISLSTRLDLAGRDECMSQHQIHLCGRIGRFSFQ